MLDQHTRYEIRSALPDPGFGCLVWLPQPHGPLRSARLGPSGCVTLGRQAVDDAGAPTFPGAGQCDDGMSRRHARVAADGSGAYVVDLCSTNGTLLNGRRLMSRVPTRLRSGDTLGVGRSWLAWLDPREAAAKSRRPAELKLELENPVDPDRNFWELDLWADVRGRWLGVNTFQSACARELRRAECYGSAFSLVVLALPSRPAGRHPAEPSDPVEDHMVEAWDRFLERDAFLGRLGADEWGLALPGSELDAGRAHAATLHTALGLAARTGARMALARFGVASARGLSAAADEATLADDARQLKHVGYLLELARDDARG